jgi:hypothetical protein
VYNALFWWLPSTSGGLYVRWTGISGAFDSSPGTSQKGSAHKTDSTQSSADITRRNNSNNRHNSRRNNSDNKYRPVSENRGHNGIGQTNGVRKIPNSIRPPRSRFSFFPDMRHVLALYASKKAYLPLVMWVTVRSDTSRPDAGSAGAAAAAGASVANHAGENAKNANPTDLPASVADAKPLRVLLYSAVPFWGSGRAEPFQVATPFWFHQSVASGENGGIYNPQNAHWSDCRNPNLKYYDKAARPQT